MRVENSFASIDKISWLHDIVTHVGRSSGLLEAEITPSQASDEKDSVLLLVAEAQSKVFSRSVVPRAS